MEAYKYRSLLWELIAAYDTGKFDNIGLDEVKLHARGGSFSRFLRERFHGDADFSLLTEGDWADLNRDAESLENAVDAQRKFGVSNRGMCLLLAYALEGLQSETRKKESG